MKRVKSSADRSTLRENPLHVCIQMNNGMHICINWSKPSIMYVFLLRSITVSNGDDTYFVHLGIALASVTIWMEVIRKISIDYSSISSAYTINRSFKFYSLVLFLFTKFVSLMQRWAPICSLFHNVYMYICSHTTYATNSIRLLFSAIALFIRHSNKPIRKIIIIIIFFI